MVTISDVAREAGVSQATVSRVLNRKKTNIPISEKTIKKVLEAAERLNYAPNRAAQNLRTGSTNCIGFLLCERPFSNQHYYVMLKYLEIELATRGKNLLFSIYNPKEELPQMLKERAVDGIFLAGRVTKDIIEKVQESRIPFIVMGSMADEACDINILTGDIEKNIETVYEYLLNKGHRDIVYFSDYKEPLLLKKISEGCKKAYKKYHIEPRTDLIKVDLKDPYSTIEKSLSEHSDVTAMVLQQHFVNVLMHVVDQRGIRIPEQLSILIFGDDNLDKWQRDYFTHLSSYTKELVACGADNLLKICNGEINRVDILIPSNIFEGKTVKEIDISKLNQGEMVI